MNYFRRVEPKTNPKYKRSVAAYLFTSIRCQQAITPSIVYMGGRVDMEIKTQFSDNRRQGSDC